jgi:glutamine amidotransferase
MCRFLAVHDKRPFTIGDPLRQLAGISRNSSEYQGDGWGCAWLEGGRWQRYRNLRPIWDDPLDRFGSTTFLLAHARSAFRNDGLEVENNMPFLSDGTVFVFNGELRGVRIQAPGRIGADKLFHFLLRFGGELDPGSIRKSVEVVKKRSRYVRALNFILARHNTFVVHSCFNETPEYFTLYKKLEGTRVSVCSEAYPDETGWTPLANDSLEVHSF